MTNRSRITDGYLAALGLRRAKATPELLREITSRHVATFAFSSIGPRLREDLPLDAASLYDRIVLRRRGGYCFEQNGLLFEVLQELGFEARLHLARVIHNQDTHPPLTHRVTVVEIDGDRLLVDVGFGSLGPRFPVSMPSESDGTPDGAFRVVERRPGEFHLQTLKDAEPFSLYRFELARYGQADCELGHFYSHRHPAATFVNNLVVSRILEDEIRSLRNGTYWVMGLAGDRTVEFHDADELMAVLQGEFELGVTREECQRLFGELPPA